MAKVVRGQKRTGGQETALGMGEATSDVSAPQNPAFDFYARVSAAELARLQGVQPIREAGQLRTFAKPDPKEAKWLVREVRRWRGEGQRGVA
jgi:hypothetical protein